jgi:hypothetical protein
MKRKTFDSVPEWDVGEPEFISRCELDIKDDSLFKGWNIVTSQIEDGVLDVEAVRFNSSLPEAHEFNTKPVTVGVFPVNNHKKRPSIFEMWNEMEGNRKKGQSYILGF